MMTPNASASSADACKDARVVKLTDPPADSAAIASASTHLPIPNLGLLGSYIASVFGAGSHGGGLLSAEPPQAWSEPLLAHPHAA